MAELQEVVRFCDESVGLASIRDFPGAHNGLQIANQGKVKKIGAAVDAGLIPFQLAAEKGIDFLIVHHGCFWSPPTPLTGVAYQKIKAAFDANLAVYGSHLPLDAHPTLGNNAILARRLGLSAADTFLPYEGTNIATITTAPSSREALKKKLQTLFPNTFCAIEYGSERPRRVAVLTGSGRSAIPEMIARGIDTLVTGELRQEHFNLAQEAKLNLYPCGHYATEVFGVQALAEKVSQQFELPWEYIETPCPL